MRLKRLMSLVLAIALALSLVTVASAANTVYWHEDFTSYKATAEATSLQVFWPSIVQTRDTLVQRLTNGYSGFMQHPGDGWMNKDMSAFVTNQAGHIAFKPGNTDDKKTKVFTMFHLFPNGGINLAADENENKTIVFSYELDYGPNSTATSEEFFPQLIWANADKTLTDTMNAFSLKAPVDGNRSIGVYRVGNGNSHATHGNDTYSATHSKTYELAVGISRGSNINATGTTANGAEENAYNVMFKKTFGINGIGNFQRNTGNTGTVVEKGFVDGETVFVGLGLKARYDAELAFTNFKLYTMDTDSFAVSASKTAGLRGNETITFNFTNPVSKAAFEANKANITVKKGEEAFTGFRVGDLVTTIANGQINSSVTIAFEGLEDSETYTVEFPAGITNEIAQPLNNSTVTLATVVPDLKVGNFTVISGWGSDDEAVVSDFTAEATLQGGKLEVANNTPENKDVAVIYAVYGHNGQLADMVYVQDVLKANGTAEIQAGVTLSENLTEGASTGKVKAFIWNTIDALTPYLGATERNIVAAQ